MSRSGSTCSALCEQPLLRLNVDAIATKHGSRGRSIAGVARDLVVVNNDITVVLIPDLDAELVDSTTAADLTVDRGDHEAVVAGTVDRAGALELGLGAGNDEPFVIFAVEVDVAGFELELCVFVRNGLALLVLRDEAKVGLPNRQSCTRGTLARADR